MNQPPLLTFNYGRNTLKRTALIIGAIIGDDWWQRRSPIISLLESILPSSHFPTADLLPCRAGLVLDAPCGCFLVKAPPPESCKSATGS